MEKNPQFKNTDDTLVLTAPQHDTYTTHRVHSLKALKRNVQYEQSDVQAQAVDWHYRPKRMPWPLRVLVWIFGCFIGLFLLTMGGVVFLTSPLGEDSMTSLVKTTVNHYGKPYGLRVYLSSIRGFWDGKIEITNLRIYDRYGPWLRVSQGTLHPDWESLTKSLIASWRFKRNRLIPEAFYDKNIPHVSMPVLPENSYGVDVQHAPFVVEKKTATPHHTAVTPPVQGRRKNTLGTAPRKGIGNASLKRLPVNNLLSPKDILSGRVVFTLKNGTLVGPIMPRLPNYKIQKPRAHWRMQSLFDFLPSWLAIDVAKLEMVDFKLGPRSRSVNFSANVHGQINSEKLLLRSTVLAARKISSQWVLPDMQDLPDDVTLSIRELSQRLALLDNISKEGQTTFEKERILGYASIDYDKGSMDVRWQLADSLISQHFSSGIESIWSRMRILAHVPTWPPNAENPAQARFVSRFGLTLAQEQTKIKPSIVSGQVFWDGNTFIVRDFDLRSPADEKTIKAAGSFGFSSTKGFGADFSASIDDLQTVAKALGINTDAVPIGGSVTSNVYISHGGDLLFWWAKPLSEILPRSHLPGYYASPYDKGILAKSSERFTKNVLLSMAEINYKTFAQSMLGGAPIAPKAKSAAQKASTNPFPKTELAPLPRPSEENDMFYFRIKTESPLLRLPNGEMKDVFFTFNGNSVRADTLPAGMITPSTQVSSVAEEHFQSDFTSDGMPHGLVGQLFLRFGNIFNKGVGTVSSQWFVGGYNEGARMFQARLEDFVVDFPGLYSDANLAFAYALPRVKRRWPWIDGDFNLHVNHWEFLNHLFQSPLRTENLNFHATLHSRLDNSGQPVQFFDSKILTDRVDSTEFMVRQAVGTAGSKHLHALVDTLALAIEKKHYTRIDTKRYAPRANIPTFSANFDLMSGRGGPVRWSKGSSSVTVTGEQANFLVRMQGEITAVLEGLFNFRSRTLSLKDMQVVTPISGVQRH